jgi:hypothetical protein
MTPERLERLRRAIQRQSGEAAARCVFLFGGGGIVGFFLYHIRVMITRTFLDRL